MPFNLSVPGARKGWNPCWCPGPPYPSELQGLKEGVPQGGHMFIIWPKISYYVSHKVWALLDLQNTSTYQFHC